MGKGQVKTIACIQIIKMPPPPHVTIACVPSHSQNFLPYSRKTIAYMFISLLNFHPPQDNSVQSEIMIKLPPLSHKTTACILLSLITCPPSSAPQFPPCLLRLHSNVTLKFHPHLLHKTMAYILKSSKFPSVPHKTIARHSEIMFKLPCRARQ